MTPEQRLTSLLANLGEAGHQLLDKLPDVLDENQKHHKVKNLIQSLKNQGVIVNYGRIWRLSKP